MIVIFNLLWLYIFTFFFTFYRTLTLFCNLKLLMSLKSSQNEAPTLDINRSECSEGFYPFYPGFLCCTRSSILSIHSFPENAMVKVKTYNPTIRLVHALSGRITKMLICPTSIIQKNFLVRIKGFLVRILIETLFARTFRPDCNPDLFLKPDQLPDEGMGVYILLLFVHSRKVQ